MKLSHYLLISFSALILAVILMTTAGSSVWIKGNFDTYLLESQLDKVEGLKVLIEKLIIKDQNIAGSSNILEDYLDRNRLLLSLYDVNGGLIYQNKLKPGLVTGQGMMRHMMEIVNEERIEILLGGKIIAYAQVGYFGDYSQSEQATNFRAALQKTMWMTAIMTLLMGMILSYFISKTINKPITAVSNVAFSVSEGNFKSRTHTRTKIRELKALSYSMDHMAEQLDEQETIRRNLMLSMGHEIKTPLTIVKTHLEGLMDKVIEPTPEHLASCYEELDRMQSIVENLEMLSAIKETEPLLHIESLSLKEEFEKSENAFKNRLLENGLTLALKGEDVIFNTDRIKLRQIIDNVLVNAIKYATPNSIIHMAIQKSKHGILFTLQNQAQTLSVEDQNKLFDIHFRTHGARGKEGRGIGLYVTKALVMQLSGQIAIESTQDTFTVNITLKDLKPSI